MVCCGGGYIPPSERDGSTQCRIEELVASRPEGSRPLVLADLNADLDCPRDRGGYIFGGSGAAWARLRHQTLCGAANPAFTRAMDAAAAPQGLRGGDADHPVKT